MKNLQILVSKQGIASKLKGRKFGKKKMLGRRLASHGKYHRDKNEFSELIQPKIEPAVNHSQSIGSDEHVLSTCESLNSTNGLPIFTQSQLGVDGNSALSEEDNNSGSMETEQSKFSQQNAWSDVSAAGQCRSCSSLAGIKIFLHPVSDGCNSFDTVCLCVCVCYHSTRHTDLNFRK